MSNTLQQIDPYEWDDNVFARIGKQWMLVAAGKPDGSVNAMTAAWGGLGFIWQTPVAFVFIRPQRCTKTFVDASPTLSLSFLVSEYRDALNFMGTVSGFDDPQKVEHSGLTLAWHEPPTSEQPSPEGQRAAGRTPYFSNAELVIITEKLYVQDMAKEHFLTPAFANSFYKEDDFHTLYIAQIKAILSTTV